MLKFVFTIFILIQAFAGQCSFGCLACGSNGACLYCDATRGYFLSGSACATTDRANCALLSQSNACLICQAPGFYLDSATLNCVAVPANATVPNCAIHSGPNGCATCQTGYFPANTSSCAAVNSSISNCATYDTSTTCLACGNGYTLNTTRTACSPVPGPGNCSLATQTQCQRCKAGFSLATGASLSGLQQTVFSPSFAFSIAQVVIKSQGFGTLALPVCFGTTNCVEYSPTDYTCIQCQSGYSFNATSGVCFQNPLPRVVDFCDIYQTASTCAKCINGYLRATASSCVPMTLLADCLTHDLTASTPKCLTCAATAYLTPLGNCVTRLVFNKPNCLAYALNADICTSCEPLYQLTSDSQACLLTIIGCLSYESSGGQSPYFVCAKCGPGTYQAQGGRLCTVGTVANCETYQTSANTCAVCFSGYRLVNQACVAVTAISYCSVYSRILDYKCETCNANAAKFTIQTGCSPVTPIANCRVYNSLTTCATCQDGYQAAGAGTSCTSVNAANCDRYSGSTCVRCNPGFYFVNNVCSNPATADTINCDTNILLGTNAGESPVGCRRCNAQSVPFDVANSLFCLATTVITAANNPTPLDANCAAWRLNSNTYVCIRCQPNFFVAAGACVATCSAGTPLRYSFALPTMAAAGKYSYTENTVVNSCGAALAVANCDSATPAIAQTTSAPAYGCPKCATGFLPFVSLTATAVLKETATSVSDTVPSLSACSASTTPVLGVANGAVMTDCTAYFSYPTYVKNACIGCAFGKTGPIRNEIYRCITFTGTDCLQCMAGYHPATNKLSCEADTAIAGCSIYDARTLGATNCLLCTLLTHYRVANGGGFTCTARTAVTDCTTYHESENKCIVCGNSKILLDGKCFTAITNCKVHKTLDADPFYECAVCDNAASYIATVGNRKECTTASIANCVQYSQANGVASAICVTCATNFILSNGVCLAAAPTPATLGNCQVPNAPTCTTCYKNALKFAITKQCTTAAGVADCAIYETATTCHSCATGKYLANPTTCSDIPAAANCLDYVPVDRNKDGKYDASDNHNGGFEFTCNICKPNFSYSNTTVTAGDANGDFSKTVCVTFTARTVENCIANGMNNDGKGSVLSMGCAGGCAANHRPYSMDGLKICVPDAIFSGTAPYTKIDNCMYYKRPSNSAAYECQACNPGHAYISASKTCATACTGGQFIARYTYSGTAGGYKIDKRNVCIDLPGGNAAIPANCEAIIPSFNLPTNTDPFNYICAQCKSGFRSLTTLDPTNNRFSPANPASSSGVAAINAILSPFNEVITCVDGTTFNDAMTANGGAVDANCEQYGPVPPDGETRYTCQRCVTGRFGVIKKRTDKAKKLAVMYNCQETTDFSTTITHTGFNTNSNILTTFGSIRSIFSGLACSAANKLPIAFLALNDQAPYKPLGWYHYADKSGVGFPDESSLANWASTSNDHNDDAPNIKCVDMTNEAELGQYLDTVQLAAANIIADCALYIINTNAVVKSATTITVNSATTRALICVACKPGFKPTYSDYSSWFYISACTAITDCATPGTIFNACSGCAFNKLPAGTVDYHACVTAAPENCLVANSADSNKCVLCNPGWIPSLTGAACVQLAATNGCTISWEIQNTFEKALGDSGNSNLVKYNYDAIIPFYSLTYFGGCSSCQANNILVEASHITDNNMIPEFCIAESLNVISTTLSPFNTANCATYGWKNVPGQISRVSCILCSATYILKLEANNPDSCITIASVEDALKTSNCEYIDMANKDCLRCKKADAFLLNKLCVPYSTAQLTAAFCSKWNIAGVLANNGLKCSVCSMGYYPTTNVCEAIPGGAPTNCGRYADGKCTACKPGYVLIDPSGTPSCLKIISGTPTDSSTTPHDSKCLTLLGTEWDAFKLQCIDCIAGAVLTEPAGADVTHFCYDYPAYVAATNCAQFVDRAATYTGTLANCVRCSSNTGFFLTNNACSARTAASTGVTNCIHYTETADTCQGCNTGFTLASNVCTAVTVYTNVGYTPATSAWYRDFYPNVRGHLESCATAITDCNSNTKYLGLDAPFAYLFSCHKCTTTGHIPFAYVFAGNGTYAGVTGLFSWGTNATVNAMGYYDDGLGIQCQNPVVGSFHASFAGKFSFPANCALGIVNVWGAFDASGSASATNVDKTKITIMCVACPPGFKPTGATDTGSAAVSGMVSSCTQIANCASSTAFNKCDACAANFGFQVDANGKIDRTACVSITVANCQLINTSNQCVLCSDGSFQNLDGICEPFKSPNCADATSKSQSTLAGVDIIDSLFYQPYKGCLACINNFSPALDTASNFVCHVSDLINSVRPANTKFTPNCGLYLRAINAQNQVLCDSCKPGFILTTAGTCITTTNSHLNCRLAVSPTVCSSCIIGSFLIIDGICTVMNIPNCVTYSQTVLTTLTCTECAPAFRLQSNQCVAGTVFGCAKYTDQGNCYQCLPDFAIRRDAAGAFSCVQAPIQMNCLTMDDSLYNQYQFGCLVCLPNFFPNSTPFNRDICYVFQAVEGCITYDVGSRVNLSTQRCTACVPTMYLNTATHLCVARTAVSLNNCLVANPTADTCTTPVPVAQAAPATPGTPSNPMNPQPTGIANCVVYDGSLNCLQCTPTTYYNGTRCVPVISANLVANCVGYTRAQLCSKCAAGYILRVGLCVGIVGTNCGTVEPARGDCLTCNNGYGLFTTNGFSNCVQLNDTNCAQWSAEAPYRCTVCNTGFALVGATCAALNQTVTNCQIHSADNICARCASGYTLNATSTTPGAAPTTTVCLQTSSLTLQGYMDPNCDSFTMTPSGSCYLCAAGFTIKNGACEACQTSQGCMICDNRDSTKCLLCQSGFFSNGTGVCFPSSPPPSQNIPNGTASNQTDFFPGTAGRINAAFLVIIVSAVVQLFSA